MEQKLEETSIVSPVMHLQAKIMSETRKKEIISKTVQGAAVSLSEPYIPVPVSSVPSIEKPKQERTKKASNPNDAATLEAVPKKKLKKKQNSDSLEAQKSPEEADEKHKHHKHITAPPPKSSLQPGAQSGSDDPS